MFESYDKKSKYSISPLWSDVRLINKVFLMEDKMEALRVPKKKKMEALQIMIGLNACRI